MKQRKKNIANQFTVCRKKINEQIEENKSKYPDIAAKLIELEKKQTEREKVQLQLLDFQGKYKLKKINITQDAYETEKSNLKEKYDTLAEDTESDLDQLREKFYY